MFITIPTFVLIIAVFIKYYKAYTKKYQDDLAVSNSIANEALSNIRVIKSFATEEKESQQYQK